MSLRFARAAAATGLAAATLFAPFATAAHAERSRPERRVTRMARIKAECARESGRGGREATGLINAITNAPHLTDEHRAALLDAAQAALDDLTAHRAAMLAATTLDETRAECRAALAARQPLRKIARIGRLTHRADAHDAALADLQGELDALRDTIDGLEADGNDVSALRLALDELQGLADAAALDVGLGDDAIALIEAEDISDELDDLKATLETQHEQLLAIGEGIDALAAQLPDPAGGAGGGDVV